MAWFKAATDEEATAIALTLYRERPGKGGELWEGNRLVHSEPSEQRRMVLRSSLRDWSAPLCPDLAKMAWSEGTERRQKISLGPGTD